MKTLAQLGLDGLRTPTARATLFHLVLVGSIVAIKSSANALYLAHHPPAGLALLYVAVAVAVGGVTALLAGPLARRAPGDLLRHAVWLLGALLAVQCGLSLGGVTAAHASLYVTGELFATTTSILFWSTATSWFDARSVRARIGVISAGGMAGSVVGGLVTRAIVDVIGPPGTIALGAAVTALSLPLLRLSTLVPGIARPDETRRIGTGGTYLRGNTYPRIVAALALAYALLAACVDFVFRTGAAARLTEVELATLFADLNAAVGVAAVAYHLLLTRRLLERVGLFISLSIIPLVLGVLGGIAALTSSFVLLAVVKGLEMAGSYSIQPAGMQLLYNPIPAPHRPAVRAFVDGLVKKAGLASAGLALALLAAAAPAALTPWLVVGLAVPTLLLLRYVRRGYLRTLERRLRGPRAAVAAPAIEVVDPATRALLGRALHSPRGTEARAALAILEHSPGFDPTEYLEALLTHPDEAVRLAAIDLVPTHSSPEVRATLTRILSSDRRRPRAAAVQALARCCPDHATSILLPFLDDQDPGVVGAVIAALAPLPETREAAHARFVQMVESPDPAPAHRRELARVLGRLPRTAALGHLPRLFEDPDSSVRALALKSAAGHFARARSATDLSGLLPLVNAVQARLAVRADRDHAREALARLGDLVVPLMRVNLDDRRLPLAIRLQIPRLLGAIGSAAAAEALLFSNIRDHPALRYRIGEHLFRLRRRHPTVPIHRGRTDAACRRRLDGFTRYRPLCHSLAAVDETVPAGSPALRAWRLLRRTTTDRLLQNLRMALQLLGLHRGTERMDRVAPALLEAERQALSGAPPERVSALRADALEVLDVALEADPLHLTVMRALEPPPARGDGSARRWPDAWSAAHTLRGSADPYIAALSRRVIADAPPGALAAVEADEDTFTGVDSPFSDPTDWEEVANMDDTLLNRILALEQVDLFSGLLVDDVAAIAAIAEERHAGPGEVLYREGEPGRNMMVLTRGRVRLTHGGNLLMELGEGESIGQVSFLDRAERPVTAVVSTEGTGAELLVIDAEQFMDLVTDRPGLTRGLFVVLAKRLRTLIDLQRGTGSASSTS